MDKKIAMKPNINKNILNKLTKNIDSTSSNLDVLKTKRARIQGGIGSIKLLGHKFTGKNLEIYSFIMNSEGETIKIKALGYHPYAVKKVLDKIREFKLEAMLPEGNTDKAEVIEDFSISENELCFHFTKAYAQFMKLK